MLLRVARHLSEASVEQAEASFLELEPKMTTKRAIDPNPATNADRRGYPRKKTLLAGRVLLSEWSTLDCTIRDWSPAGARLVFSVPIELPRLFRLLIVSTGKMVPATLVWQKGLAAGVSFELPANLGPR